MSNTDALVSALKDSTQYELNHFTISERSTIAKGREGYILTFRHFIGWSQSDVLLILMAHKAEWTISDRATILIYES